MATTAISNIINPEVLGDQLAAKFPDMLVFGRTNVVRMDGDFALGSPGTQFKIPAWKRLTGFTDMTEGTPLSTNNLSTYSEYALVQRGGTAVSINDTAELVSKADPVGEVSNQLGRLAAEYIDQKLVAAVSVTPNVYNIYSPNGSSPVTLDMNALITGMIGYNPTVVSNPTGLGDNYMSLLSGGVVVMHSKVYGDLMKLGLIQNLYQAGIPAIQQGMFATILGLPIFLSDRVTVSTVSTLPVYSTFVVGPECLGLFYQRQVLVEFDRDILGQADIVAATVHFAAHLFGYDESSSTVKAEQNKSIHAVVIKSN